MKYNPSIVVAFFTQNGLPKPELELRFHPVRKWRFDFAWNENPSDNRRWVALEVEGGVWIGGRHSQGAGKIKDMEKYSEAACLGWRIIYVEPKYLCTMKTVSMLKRALGVE